MSLRFSPSKDGLKRATVRIPFRVGLNTLEIAAASLVHKALIEDSLDPGAASDDLRYEAAVHMLGLTHREIVAEVRELLQASGYSLGDHAEDEYFGFAYEAARARVPQLWPELREEEEA